MSETNPVDKSEIDAFRGLVEPETAEVDEVLSDHLPLGWFWMWDKFGHLRLLTDEPVARTGAYREPPY